MPKTILITGAGTGIGHDTALALARRGHHIIATGRTLERMADLRETAKKEELDLETEKLDLTVKKDAELIREIAPDILINNGALGDSGPLAEMPEERIRELFETNVFGTLRVTQAALGPMLERGHGRVITVTSLGGIFVLPHLGAYNMTKFALEAMVDALRRETRGMGVDFVAVQPGNIGTGFNQKMIAKKWQWMKKDSAWKHRFDDLRRYDKEFWDGAHATEPVVNAMTEAAESAHPRPKIVAPKNDVIYKGLARVLPARAMDRVIRFFTKV